MLNQSKYSFDELVNMGDDGSVTSEIASRAKHTYDKCVWMCGEVVWTEEWKAECVRRRGIA